MSLPESDARDVHRRLDTDGNGYITTDDLEAAVHDFYFDEDLDGVGSWLLATSNNGVDLRNACGPPSSTNDEQRRADPASAAATERSRTRDGFGSTEPRSSVRRRRVRHSRKAIRVRDGLARPRFGR
jgi:hypothetical protein